MSTPRGPQLRIGDAEREAACSALGEHFAAGRLSREEYDERSTIAWAAKTEADLAPLFADLPSPQARQRPAAAPGSRQLSGPHPPYARGSCWRFPFLPALLIAIALVLVLPGPPWPLFVLGAIWLFARSHRRSQASGRVRAERGSWS
jgi:hypothetical protein